MADNERRNRSTSPNGGDRQHRPGETDQISRRGSSSSNRTGPVADFATLSAAYQASPPAEGSSSSRTEFRSSQDSDRSFNNMRDQIHGRPEQEQPSETEQLSQSFQDASSHVEAQVGAQATAAINDLSQRQDAPSYTESEMRDIDRNLRENLRDLYQRYINYGRVAWSIGELHARRSNRVIVHLREFTTHTSDLTRDLRNFNTQVDSFNASLGRNPIDGLSSFLRLPLAHTFMNDAYHDAGMDHSVIPFSMTAEGIIQFMPGRSN